MTTLKTAKTTRTKEPCTAIFFEVSMSTDETQPLLPKAFVTGEVKTERAPNR
jgi:hypothetical protein